MMNIDKQTIDAMIGLSNGSRTLKYTWRDVVLYALGVGAHKEELQYVYEGAGLKALPTFVLVPYINAINLEPRRRLPRHPANIVRDILAEALENETLSPLHMSMEMEMHGKINSMQGTFLCEDKVAQIYDRGEGKGIAVETQMDVYDIAGNPVSTLKGMHLIGACGGFGGEKIPSHTLVYPERDPDYSAVDHMQETQHLLYRLSGDLNTVHVDPEAAKSRGFKDAFMQGLCSCGYACRMAIGWCVPGNPEKLSYFYAQMRNICYPGENVQFVGWNMGNGKIIFRLLNEEKKAILDNGVMIFKN